MWAGRMGISGTPAFAFGVIEPNGEVIKVSQMVLGAQSHEDFKGVLDELLSSMSK